MRVPSDNTGVKGDDYFHRSFSTISTLRSPASLAAVGIARLSDQPGTLPGSLRHFSRGEGLRECLMKGQLLPTTKHLRPLKWGLACVLTCLEPETALKW